MSESGNPLVQHWRFLPLGALAAALIYSGMRLAKQSKPAPEPRRSVEAAAGLMPPPAGHAAPAPVVAAAPDGVADPLSFDGFLRILEERAKDPAVSPMAKVFKARFMAQPGLRATYERFRSAAAQGKRPSAAAFMAALRKKPEFRSLTGDLGRQPGAPGALQSFMQQPDLRRFARQESFALGPAPPARVAPSLPESRTPPPASSSPGAKPAAFEPAPAAVTAGAASPDVAAEKQAVAAPARAGSAPPSKPSDPGRPRPAPDSKSASRPKPAARSPAETEQAVADSPWLSMLSPQERGAILQWGQLGFWGACFRLGLHGRCSEACSASPRGCRGHTAWESCLDAFGAESRCAAECSMRGCAPPAEVLARLCGKEPRPGYCPEPGAPPASGPVATPCQPSDTIAADCSTWEDADPAAKASFLAYWGSQGLSPEEVRKRWVWEYNQDRTHPGWRNN